MTAQHHSAPHDLKAGVLPLQEMTFAMPDKECARLLSPRADRLIRLRCSCLLRLTVVHGRTE